MLFKNKTVRLFSNFSPNVVAYYPFYINFELKALKQDKTMQTSGSVLRLLAWNVLQNKQLLPM